MTTDDQRAEIVARLEEVAARNPGNPFDAEELNERHLNVAIQILDSEHMNYPKGELEQLLRAALKQLAETGSPDTPL